MRATGDGSPKKPGRIRHGVDVVLDFIAGCVSPVIPVLLVHWRHDMGERHLWYMGRRPVRHYYPVTVCLARVYRPGWQPDQFVADTESGTGADIPSGLYYPAGRYLG